MKLTHIAPMFALVSLVAASTVFAQLEPPPPQHLPVDTTAVAQRDAMDIIAKLLNKRVEPELSGSLRETGLKWAILPTISYNPVYGAAFGALISGAGQRGQQAHQYSQLAISANYSTKGQFQAQVRGDVYSPSANYLFKVDARYLDTQRSTWGLGRIVEGQEEFPMEFELFRIYSTVYRRASGPVYIGVGYHFDEFDNIVDQRALEGESTPFTEYSGAGVTRTVASGFSLNVLGDTRDNLVNPAAGYYLSASFRDYMTTVASDENWQELWAEMRLYPHVPKMGPHVLAFWLFGWRTFGDAPYLNLPSSGWDTYGRAARGYLQGRIRGANQLYFETEYRRRLSRDGLLGAVAFINGTTTTDPASGLFGRTDAAWGVGLRIKLNKHTNTNITVDYGFGRDDSRGLFLGMSEVF